MPSQEIALGNVSEMIYFVASGMLNHNSVNQYKPDALPAAQSALSEHRRELHINCSNSNNNKNITLCIIIWPYVCVMDV